MSNSSLVTYKRISPHKTVNRNHKIDTITIHCAVGQWTAKQGCDYFATTNRSASCNYFVGKDGSIGLCVEEKDRSWCSSSSSNDNRAITIEVASDTTHPYKCTDAALKALITLITDICNRNGIKKLKWSTNKNDRINHLNGCNMTVHRDFANKSCPGEYLYNKHSYIAEKVNSQLGVNNVTQLKPPTNSNKLLYRVRKSWNDINSQIGAYSNLENAKTACKDGYKIFDWNGKQVYPEIQNNKNYLVKVTTDILNVRKGPGVGYGKVTTIKKNEVYTIIEEKNGWGKLKLGVGWISLAYVKKI